MDRVGASLSSEDDIAREKCLSDEAIVAEGGSVLVSRGVKRSRADDSDITL